MMNEKKPRSKKLKLWLISAIAGLVIGTFVLLIDIVMSWVDSLFFETPYLVPPESFNSRKNIFESLHQLGFYYPLLVALLVAIVIFILRKRAIRTMPEENRDRFKGAGYKYWWSLVLRGSFACLLWATLMAIFEQAIPFIYANRYSDIWVLIKVVLLIAPLMAYIAHLKKKWSEHCKNLSEGSCE